MNEETVINLLSAGKKIPAIKLFRSQNPGLGLREAKRAVDVIELSMRHGDALDKLRIFVRRNNDDVEKRVLDKVWEDTYNLRHPVGEEIRQVIRRANTAQGNEKRQKLEEIINLFLGED